VSARKLLLRMLGIKPKRMSLAEAGRLAAQGFNDGLAGRERSTRPDPGRMCQLACCEDLRAAQAPSSLPGTLTLADIMNAPQTATQPVCGGNPFISDPCPVANCKMGCDKPC
jgi:hypothetical protein